MQRSLLLFVFVVGLWGGKVRLYEYFGAHDRMRCSADGGALAVARICNVHSQSSFPVPESRPLKSTPNPRLPREPKPTRPNANLDSPTTTEPRAAGIRCCWCAHVHLCTHAVYSRSCSKTAALGRCKSAGWEANEQHHH